MKSFFSNLAGPDPRLQFKIDLHCMCFTVNFNEIFQNSFFTEHHPTTVSLVARTSNFYSWFSVAGFSLQSKFTLRFWWLVQYLFSFVLFLGKERFAIVRDVQ